MADINAGAEKTNIETKHLAAVLAPKINKAPVPKSLLHLQDLLAKEKGKSVFEAKVAKDDADIYVNFNEMKQMVDSERNPLLSDEDQSPKWKSLNQKLTIYDKLINGNVDKLGKDAEGNDSPEELIVVRRTLGEIPGFAEAIAVGTGGKMSIEQVQKFLAGNGSIPTGLKKTVGEMIGRFIGDDELRRRMEKSLSTISDIIPEKDVALQSEIDSLKVETSKKDSLKRKQLDYEETIGKYEDGLSSVERALADDYRARIADDLRGITEAKYKPSILNVGVIANKIGLIESEIQELQDQAAALRPAATAQQNRNQDAVREYNELNSQVRKLKSTTSLLNDLSEVYNDPNASKLIKIADDYTNAQVGLTEVETKLAEIAGKERQITEKEAERRKYVDKYNRKIERTLSEEMKRYWNDVKMVEAAQTAEAEANEKKEVEETAKAKAEVLLDKYLHLSFMKYKSGKVVGWDDKAIKDFMHKDMLSQSPAQLARTFIERIDNKSGGMPPQYQDEIAQLFKDMGVGKGVPPLTFDKVMEKIGQKNFEEFAAKKVPDMLGYAWARGYYFDRMKLKPHEARFLQEAYNNPEFFATAMKDRDEQIKLAQGLLKDGVLSGLISPDKIKELIGKDWTEGGAKLLKILAVGAGATALSGGLMYLPFAGQVGGIGEALKLGGKQVLNNLGTVGMVAGQTIVGASRLGNAAVQGVFGNSTINSLNPMTMSKADVAALGLDPAKTGPQQAGGLLQKLSELSRATAKPVMAPNGQILKP